MSTTFGVIDPENTEEFIEVAFRGNNSIVWKQSIAQLLPRDTPVIPLDNTAQGIITIGDIKDAIYEQDQKILND